MPSHLRKAFHGTYVGLRCFLHVALRVPSLLFHSRAPAVSTSARTSAHPHRCPRPYTRSSLRLSQILRRPPQEYRTAPENSHKSPPPFYMSTAAASVALVAAVAGKDDHDEEEKALIHRSQTKTKKMTPLGVCLHRRSQQDAILTPLYSLNWFQHPFFSNRAQNTVYIHFIWLTNWVIVTRNPNPNRGFLSQ